MSGAAEARQGFCSGPAGLLPRSLLFKCIAEFGCRGAIGPALGYEGAVFPDFARLQIVDAGGGCAETVAGGTIK